MSKRVELIIGEYPNQISLDLTDNAITIALQYSIDDIRDIDKKNSNHSKNIIVPGTKKNNDAFGNLFDVNQTFTQFNPNLKRPARIVIDSSPVLEGYIQLTAVNKMNNADLQGNLISYNVIVFDDSIDFIQTLGDKELIDLNLTDSNHIYGMTAIENAWNTHTYSDIYQYPLLDKITQGYFTKDFKPAFYHKGLLLKIADEAGYTLEGSFITTDDNGIGPNTQYEKEIISWDGDNPLISDQDAALREYKGGATGDILPVTIKGITGNKSVDFYFNQSKQDSFFPDITVPFYDNSGGYASTATRSTWTSTNKGKFNFKSRFKTELSLTGQGVTANVTSGYVKTIVRAYVRGDIYVNGIIKGSSINEIGTFPDLTSLDPSIPATSVAISRDITLTFNTIDVNVGDDVYFKYTIVTSANGNTPSGLATIQYFVDNNFGGSPANYQQSTATMTWNQYQTMNSGEISYFENETVKDDNIDDGDEISLSAYVPKNIKQKDILGDIVRRYNVYVRKHPTKSKTLILETRDNFYNNNVTILDWTQKKDYTSEDKIQFLSELQNKEILFTYKPDNSATGAGKLKWNESYTTSTGDIYGQKKVSFNNDFVQGTKKIESIFSSAPLIFRGDTNTMNDVVVPALSSSISKRNPALLYWGGMIPVKDSSGATGTGIELDITWGATGNAPTTYTEYPYAGHYDNPYDPTLDIHYGEVTYEYYGTLLNNATDNNLFNQEWRNYINQIADGKLVTSKFYLKETDINFIKDNLNSRIFVKDSYYIINKIVDYKPIEDGLTTVELSRIEQGTDFFPSYTPPVLTVSTFGQINSIIDTKDVSNGPFRSNITNRSNTSNAVIVGENNYVGDGTTGIVNGNDNVVGNDAIGISITGNNNNVSAGVSNVTIVGDGITVTESNTSVINGSTFTPSTVISGIWDVGTGLESILQVNTLAPNIALGDYSISTGSGNTVNNNNSVAFGSSNTINNTLGGSVITGNLNSDTGLGYNFITGTFNVASATALNSFATGVQNTVSAGSSFVSGNQNTASATSSFVGGGGQNLASATGSFVGGGSINQATALNSAILGGNLNTLSVLATNSAIIGGQSITVTIPNTVAVPAITFGNENVPWKFIEIEIGDWDMDANSTPVTAPAHGLSATEWRTVRSIDVMIRRDSLVAIYNLTSSPGGVTDGTIGAVDSTSIYIQRTVGGGFDNTQFTTTSFNRGFVTFWYKPD
tara:strand:- start:1211 stop:4852 length:3642 start_codon:yes stop_codon:yes gene_type:complete